jgi:hypothetical protein
MKNLSLIALFLLTISSITNTDYNIRFTYHYDDLDDTSYDYDDYDYNSHYSDYDYEYYYTPTYKSSYYSNSYNVYQKEKEAEIAYQDARIAQLKAKLARLKYRNASRYVIIQAERELEEAIYQRYPHLKYNPKAASDLLIGMGIVFIVAGLLNS